MRRIPAITVGVLLTFLVGCTATPPTGTTTTTTTEPPTRPYSIVIRPVGTMDPAVSAAFANAAARWERIITADVPDLTPSPSFDGCLGVGPTGVIDDMVIDVEVDPIDGAGNVLGSAGPCLSGPDGLPRAGEMHFDSADVANLVAGGRFDAVVLHEMGHVLGVGTSWGALLTGGGTADPRFTGANAVAEWHALGGTGTVPVEDTGGAGTAGSHWRESVFGNELMTGWISSTSNPLSRMTIASLEDLGYHVDLSQADPYTLPAGLLAPLLRAGGTPLIDSGPVAPIGRL